MRFKSVMREVIRAGSAVSFRVLPVVKRNRFSGLV
jgi:hypothetical protein